MVFTSPNYYNSLFSKTACFQKQLVFKKQLVFENKLFFSAKKVNGPLVTHSFNNLSLFIFMWGFGLKTPPHLENPNPSKK